MVDQNGMERLKESMSRARKLISMDSTISKIAKAHQNDINVSEGIDLKNAMTTTRNVAQKTPTRMQESASKLPTEIIESFKKNPTYDKTSEDISRLFENKSNDANKDVSSQVQSALNVQSNGLVYEQPTQQTIDYPTIRAIVEDVVRKYSSALNKKILSESKQQNINELNTMVVGKKFKFLDSKGNIYEATLKKVGNINNKA